MKLTDLLSWSFVAVSFIIYIISQFLLGILFIGDSWQVSEGPKYRLRKLLELGVPTVSGILAGYYIEIPAPDVILVDAVARAVYFGFAGGASPMIHTAVEAIFPSLATKIGEWIKSQIPGSNSPERPTNQPSSSSASHEDSNKKG